MMKRQVFAAEAAEVSVRVVYDRKKTATAVTPALVQVELRTGRVKKYFTTGVRVYPRQWDALAAQVRVREPHVDHRLAPYCQNFFPVLGQVNLIRVCVYHRLDFRAVLPYGVLCQRLPHVGDEQGQVEAREVAPRHWLVGSLAEVVKHNAAFRVFSQKRRLKCLHDC